MRRGKRSLWWFFLTGVGIVALLTKGLAIRHIRWEGDAPIGFGRMVAVQQRLLGQPLWSVTERKVRQWLAGEMVGQVRLRRHFPSTLVIEVNAPPLLGVIHKGDYAAPIDERGKMWRPVPLYATRLPFLLIANPLPLPKAMPAIKRTLEICRQERLTVRAVWVDAYGQAGIYLSGKGWLRLGNPKELTLKVRLGKVLWQNRLLTPQTVADLSLLRVIALWSQGPSQPTPPNKGQRR